MIRFGAFTDSHYAKNLTNGDRRCDLSLIKLENIVNDFNNQNLNFCICLGDIINSVQDYDKDKSFIQDISTVFNNLSMPYHVVLGNHDLEAMSKADYYEILDKKINSTYYSFSIQSTKFIILDANYLPDGSEYRNGNYEWTDSYINQKQINWLDNELKYADEKNIIIFIHQILDYKLYNNEAVPHLVVNYKDVVCILERYNKNITIIQGHYHMGDYQVINNITYITIKALCFGDDTSYIPRIIVTIDTDVSIDYLE